MSKFRPSIEIQAYLQKKQQPEEPLVMENIINFNYGQLEEKLAFKAKTSAEIIKTSYRRATSEIILIGKTLLEMKEELGHGIFLAWIKHEFDMSESTANNYMQSATRFGNNPDVVAALKTSVLYELAAPKTPDPVVDSITEQSSNGIVPTLKEVKQIKKHFEQTGEVINIEQLREEIRAELQREHERALEVKQSELEEANRRAHVAEAGNDVKQSELDSQRRMLDNLRAEKRRLEGEQQQANTQIEQLQGELEQARNCLEEATSDAARLDAQKELDRLNNLINTKERELRQKREEIKYTQENMELLTIESESYLYINTLKDQLIPELAAYKQSFEKHNNAILGLAKMANAGLLPKKSDKTALVSSIETSLPEVKRAIDDFVLWINDIQLNFDQYLYEPLRQVYSLDLVSSVKGIDNSSTRSEAKTIEGVETIYLEAEEDAA